MVGTLWDCVSIRRYQLVICDRVSDPDDLHGHHGHLLLLLPALDWPGHGDRDAKSEDLVRCYSWLTD